MDNRRLDITAEGNDALASALALAWPGAACGKATHFKVVNLVEKTTYYGEPTSRHHTANYEDEQGTPTMILLWSGERDASPLPYPMGLEEAASMVNGWLESVPRGQEPDIDGSCGYGWRVFTEAWGHVFGHHYAIVAVQPEWALYGK